MANDAIPFFEDGDELTCTVTGAAVSGKTLVKISGDLAADGTFQVATAVAGDYALGVAMWDAAVGQRVTVHTIESHHCMPIVTAGVLAANDPVKVTAAGMVVKASAGDAAVGRAGTSAASAADGMILLSRHTA
jgi:hypothetical protein